VTIEAMASTRLPVTIANELSRAVLKRTLPT
jgi:hypothetical protein